MANGKKRRLHHFFYPQSTQGLIIPLDHGLTMGPLPGIRSVAEIQKWINHEAITGVIAHKGLAERLNEAHLIDGKALMIHLNGMSTLASRPNCKRMLTSVQTAKSLGADGVSVQVNFDGTNDAENLELLGQIVDQAASEALPVLAMVYDKVLGDEASQTRRLLHLLRIAIELGCDAVKIAAPAQLEAVVRSVSEDIKVFIAGGDLVETNSLVELCRRTVAAGGSGLCVGRNVFQRECVGDILQLLHENMVNFPRKVSELPVARGVYGVH